MNAIIKSHVRLFLIPVILAAGLLSTAGGALAASAPALSQTETAAGLKEALSRGAEIAVRQLSAENGFFGNERVRIPLPEPMQKAESLLRRFGMARQMDELVLLMNRAAEAAMPQARALLVKAIREMSIQDARNILSGPDDAATQYFRRVSTEPLMQTFLPVVKKATDRVKLAERYNALAQTGARFGLLSAEDASIEVHVARKALDGLYLLIAEEEKRIRADPLSAASSVIRKVFGSLGR